jgi:hypothetical protein
MKAMKEIKFPSMLSMDYPNLVSEALGACMEVPYGERFMVDLTDLQKVSAFGVAAFGARVAWLIRAKRMPTGSVVRRPESGRASNDLMRMGLYSLLQDASVGVYQKDMDQRPQELWLVDDPADLPNACARLINLLRSVLPASDQNFERVQGMMLGLADNVFRHAKSSTGAMLCAQAFPKAGVVEFAVADTGVGIWTSLARFFAFAGTLQGDAHAILTALTLKVQAPDGQQRPGFLNTMVATARKAQGELVCMSGEAALLLRNGELRTISVPPYAGTVVGMRLRLFAKDEG